MKIVGYTIADLSKLLKKKKISAVEVTREYITRAKGARDLYNAYNTICEDVALDAARKADEIIAKGEASTLTGIPFGVKDAICTKGVVSTGGANILKNYVPPFDATVIKKIRDAGGVLLGKHNCDAFGHGASNENSHFGPVKNPHDPTRVPGGSSGGSAAAVAADACVYAIAEDTGGSIRQPASFCGLAGLRPSYGRNSRYGIMPMASSLDTVGPLAKTVEDVAIIMEAIAGHDPLDSTTPNKKIPKYTRAIKKPLGKIKIGLPKEYWEAIPDAEVARVMDSARERLQKSGVEFVQISLPHTKYAVPAYYIIVPAEDSSNLARLDGIRYGARIKDENLFKMYEKTRAAGFPDECKRRIMIGTYVLSHGYYDAYYKRAMKVRTLICKDFDEAFKNVDIIMTPTTPTMPFLIGEKSNDPVAMYLADIFAVSVSLAGLPAISVNAGWGKAKGVELPVGAQFIGPRFAEEKVLQIAYNFEQLV